MGNKRGSISLTGNLLVDLLIFAVILIIGFTAYYILAQKGLGAIDFIKDFLRFGR